MKQIFYVLWLSLILIAVSAHGSPAQQEPLFDGLIEPSEVVHLCSQVTGTLEAVTVERGDRVTKGQVVAVLHHEIEKAIVNLVLARMEFIKRKMLRNEELYRKKLISIHDKDEMETDLKISELQVREAQERLESRTIRSPINGVVVERFLSPGEYVGEGPIVKIARLRPLFVEVVVPDEIFGTIEKGLRAEIIPQFLNTGKYFARVVIVDSVIDAASGTFGVRLELPNPNDRLPPGLKCKVRFVPAASTGGSKTAR